MNVNKMPKIKIDKVVSFSTEDPNHPASNLLTPDPAKKWKCAKVGEKNANVILQLEKATKISSIDIGNEGSAYIEVLVSRSSSDEYKVFLGMSSFMTALESRNNQNVNQVRMFASKDFSSPECDEKWDRVKFVCIQPYNKHAQYGLSFITIHAVDDNKSNEKKAFTSLLLRPESPNTFMPGSLFAKEKDASQSIFQGAVAIREASKNPALLSTPNKSPLVAKLKKFENNQNDEEGSSSSEWNRNRNNVLYEHDDDAPNEKIDKLIEMKKNEQVKNKPKDETPKEVKKRRTDGERNDENATPKKRRNVDVASTSCSPRNKVPAKVKPKNPRKPFQRLLEGVVFAISGIANPERAHIRTEALSLGAKYKPDWNDSCTHLICAFANTPKFNQVRGRGKIVKKQWIAECAAARKRIPWRRFALDTRDQTGNESEEEIWEECDDQRSSIEQPCSDNSDTDTEIERINQNIRKNKKVDISPKTNGAKNENVEIAIDVTKLPVLPNYFTNYKFYLSPTLGDMSKQLKQCIIAFNGKIITRQELQKQDKNMIAITLCNESDEICALEELVGCIVSPIWIMECHNKNRFAPFDDFILHS